MKANPGGTIHGSAIIGREREIGEVWSKLESQSVILSAERRVGKTCILRKMAEYPRNGWIPLLCWVEQCGHPIECVERIYSEAERMEAQSGKGVWLHRVRSVYQKVAGTEIAGWKVPTIMSDWKQLLRGLVEDVANNTGKRMLVMLDEFPLMVSKMMLNTKEAGPTVAMDFLDTLRAIRQEFEPTGQIRFVLSGSIGLHLILETLRTNHEYKSNPKSDMATCILGGMGIEDVRLMCRAYLEDEGIQCEQAAEFEEHMLVTTDGLPLYIQHVCSHFQEDGRKRVACQDIDDAVREMLDNRTIEGFLYAAKRIKNYYAKLHLEDVANCILKMLCHQTDHVSEKTIIEHVRTQIPIEHDETGIDALELLHDDNYLIRDTGTGERRYRFQYNIMRRWWQINKG